MKKISYIIVVVLMLMDSRAFAAEPAPSEEPTSKEVLEEIHSIEAEETVYSYPVLKPEFFLFGGYRMVDLSGSTRADEFEYLHDSFTLGGEMRAFLFPHRLHLDVDIRNRKDYFGEGSYTYEDMVVFRGINRTIFHNLDNIRLIDLNPSTLSPGVDVRDADAKYGVRFGMSSLFLRLKTHDFPFHVYLDGTIVEREGTQQLRRVNLLNNVVRISQSRDIDWTTKSMIIGANSHVGPVEIDLSHGEKRFDAGGEKRVFDSGPQGEFPRNLIPDLKSSSNTLKLHSSYTGGFVASATLSKIDKENRNSGSSADYFIGAGEIVWTPLPRLAVFFKYRHKDVDIDTPSNVTITDRITPSNSFTFAVKPSVSSATDVVSGMVRYRPLSGVTLRGEYSYEDIRRDNADAWNLPNTTQKNIASLSADVRLSKGLMIRARYAHKEIVDPAYNVEPDHGDEGRLLVSWIPLPKLSALFSYTMNKEKRDNLFFEGTEEANNRNVRRDNILGSVTIQACKNLSLTAGYLYMHHTIKQDIAFTGASGGILTDSMVPNKDTVQHYSFDMNYLPKDFLNINAGIGYTLSRGDFYPSSIDLTVPLSIASFSELRTRELVYSISGEYRFRKDFGLSLQYRYSNFNDVIDNPYDDVTDGKAHFILLTLSKKW